ncbi:MAG TPA: DUF1232 domain-containing protein [Longimicrobiales bacterium]
MVGVWLAARDPRVSWCAKVVAGVVAAYALSPIDLIPDFVPVLGYLDDLLLGPAGLLLAIQLIPAPLMAEFRAEAERLAARPTSHGAAMVIVAVWLGALALVAWWLAAKA